MDSREPTCVHSEPGLEQPMSWCRICVDDPRLQEWRDYWAERPELVPDSAARGVIRAGVIGPSEEPPIVNLRVQFQFDEGEGPKAHLWVTGRPLEIADWNVVKKAIGGVISVHEAEFFGDDVGSTAGLRERARAFGARAEGLIGHARAFGARADRRRWRHRLVAAVCLGFATTMTIAMLVEAAL